MILAALLSLIPASLAADGQPGLWLPGATPLGSATGQAGVGVQWDDGGGQSVLLKGIVGAGQIVAINAEGYVGAGGDGGRWPDLGVGARFLVLNKDGFGLAPYGHFEFEGRTLDSFLGLAGAFSGEHIRVDASLTLIAAETGNGGGTVILPPDAMAWLEAGVAFFPARGQELRLGALSRDELLATVTYRWFGGWWYVEPSLMYWPGELSARAHAGVRF